ncbi:MAG: Mrp/NBP35 family ATP-binding protein [Myxococcota bacterium]
MSDQVKNLILIASGKGGVGKSTIATNVALAIAKSGAATGLLDADVYGPSIPTMLGDAERPTSRNGHSIMPIEKFGLKLMSMGYLVDANTAMIWRGPMLAGAVTQFVNDVEWGALDYLILDLPPGTGDIQLTLAQQFKVTGAVLVTTPQTVAISDVVRAKAMFDKVRIETLGLIENMSYFLCPSCNDRHEIFAHGGGERAAGDLEIPFLGSVPLEIRVRESGDRGVPVVESAPDSESAKSFVAIADALIQKVEAVNIVTDKQERKRKILPIVSQ